MRISAMAGSVWGVIYRYRDTRDSKAQAGYDRSHFGGLSKVHLTGEEKEQIKQKWHSVTPNISRGYDFYRGMKLLGDFNPEYLPSCYYAPFILRKLNQANWNHLLAHKSLQELVFRAGVKHPVTVLRSYGGVILDSDFRLLTKAEAAKLIKHSETPLIFKPAIDTQQGAGIKLYKTDELSQLAAQIENGEIFGSGKGVDFMIQQPVKQSEETKILNHSSLNCFRITTLNLNGKVSVCARAIKCGLEGSIVDNIGEGKKGVLVGISPAGSLRSTGFYGNGEITDSHNGVKFDDVKITDFNKVTEAAIAMHQQNDSCKIIGWDIALDSDNNPVLIEGNVMCPGISIEQMCCGPVFGDRTDEVISYLINH